MADVDRVPAVPAAATVPGTGIELGGHTWCELTDRPTIVVVPLGSCEQHGPHLPLDTDTHIAVALANASATGLASLDDARPLVAPPVAITASGEHAGFPGTLSIGTAALTAVLVELIRSADWAVGVVLVNGHGGNVDAVRAAVRQSTADGRHVLAWWPAVPGGDAHAGRTETSLMLAIEPAAVQTDLAEAGHRGPLAEVMTELRAGGVRAVAPNGVLGDPAGATADEGRALFATLVDDLVASVRSWWQQRPGSPS